MFDLKRWIAKVSSRLADEVAYIEYEDTVGSWRIRVYNNGEYEAWRKITGNATCNTSSNGVYRTSDARSTTLPAELIGTTIEDIQMTGYLEGVASGGIQMTSFNSTTGVIQFYPFTHTSFASRAYTCYVNVKGSGFSN